MVDSYAFQGFSIDLLNGQQKRGPGVANSILTSFLCPFPMKIQSYTPRQSRFPSKLVLSLFGILGYLIKISPTNRQTSEWFNTSHIFLQNMIPSIRKNSKELCG